MKELSVNAGRRRSFLRQVAGAAAAVPFAPALVGGAAVAAVAADAATADPSPSTSPNADPVVGFLCFSQDEAAFVEVMVNIMCPADDLTPNGVDCGLPIYIDRQLAGDFGRGAKRYSRGPWIQGKPQHGYQLPMTPEQHFKAGVLAANEACVARLGKPFDQIAATDASAFLGDLSAGKVVDERLPLAAWFNELVYPLFTQACFADPIYGGNYNKIFWKLIGYPGPLMNYRDEIDKSHGVPWRRKPVSLAQLAGRPVKGWEDEKD